MAIFHFDLVSVSRRLGGSAVAALAYITGTVQVDERTGRTYDYSRKAKEVLATGKVGPANWQATERAEKRWDSKVARTIIVALPHELDLRAQHRLVSRYAAWLRWKYGVAIEWTIHQAPEDARNIHAHLLLTTRRVDQFGLHGAKLRELDRRPTSKAIITRWRQAWEQDCNAALATVAPQARIDSRSLVARGIARPTRMHLGPLQSEQQRRGYQTEIGVHNARVDKIERINEELALVGRRLHHLWELQRRARVKRQIKQGRQRARRIIGASMISPIVASTVEPRQETPARVSQKLATSVVKQRGRRR